MPISREALESKIAGDMASADAEQVALYRSHAVTPQLVRIKGDHRHEEVWVVARKGAHAIWYDDVEDGFNCSLVVDGAVAEPGYEEDPLGTALSKSFRD